MSNSPGGNIAVGITAIDRTKAGIAAARKSISGIGDGLGRLRGGMKEAAKAADELGQNVSKIFTPFEGLASLATLAGIGEMERRFASAGVEIGNTSRLIGISSRTLQSWRGAAQLAGLSGGAATGALGNLGMTLYKARVGLDAYASSTARQFNLNIDERPGKFLEDLSDKMQGMSAQRQHMLADAFGVGALLPLLQRGRAAIERYEAAARRHLYMNDQMRSRAEALNFAYVGLGQSIEGFGYTLAADLAPKFVPVLTSMSKWLDELKKDPPALKAVEVGIGALATMAGVTMVSGIARMTVALNAWWALPAVRGLAALASSPLLLKLLGPGGAFIATMWPGATNAGEPDIADAMAPGGLWSTDRAAFWRKYPQYDPAIHPELAGPTAKPDLRSRAGLTKKLYDYATGPLGLDKTHAAALLGNAYVESSFNTGAVGASGERGMFQWLGDRWTRAKSALGAKALDPIAELTYAMHEMKTIDPGWASRPGSLSGLTDEWMREFEKPKNQTPGSRTGAAQAVLDAVKQDAGSAKQSGGITIHGVHYANIEAFNLAMGGEYKKYPDPYLPADEAAADTHHHVQIDLTGAPHGTRAQITGARGPATAGLRVQYAMSGDAY